MFSTNCSRVLASGDLWPLLMFLGQSRGSETLHLVENSIFVANIRQFPFRIGWL